MLGSTPAAPSIAVPKFTIAEDGDAIAYKSEIWTAEDRILFSVAKARTPEGPSESRFNHGAGRPNSRHRVADAAFTPRLLRQFPRRFALSDMLRRIHEGVPWRAAQVEEPAFARSVATLSKRSVTDNASEIRNGGGTSGDASIRMLP